MSCDVFFRCWAEVRRVLGCCNVNKGLDGFLCILLLRVELHQLGVIASQDSFSHVEILERCRDLFPTDFIGYTPRARLRRERWLWDAVTAVDTSANISVQACLALGSLHN